MKAEIQQIKRTLSLGELSLSGNAFRADYEDITIAPAREPQEIWPSINKDAIRKVTVEGIPEYYTNVSDTTADENAVLAGRVFYDADGVRKVGTMVDDFLKWKAECMTSFHGEFCWNKNTSLDNVTSKLDTSEIQDMSYMFAFCENVQTLDLSGFNTSNVRDMDGMLRDCKALTAVNVSGWDVSKVEYLKNIFAGCGSLAALDLSGWQTSSLLDISGAFMYCEKLAELNVNHFDTSKVTSAIFAFSRCKSLKTLDLSNWQTGKIKHMTDMFEGCENLESVNVSGWDTSALEDMDGIFESCSSLAGIDLSGWDTSGALSMTWAFKNCTKLEEITGALDMSSIMADEFGARGIFEGCTALRAYTLKNIKSTTTIGGPSYGYQATNDTLINTIKELWNYAGTETTCTLTMGGANLEKIANIYVKLTAATAEQIAADPNIENKMPCEVCASTDDGAILLEDYARLKNWALA